MKQTGQTQPTAKSSKGDATKARLVASALGTFHTQGYRGTGVAQLLAESGFPRGSLYFHFPGGKEEIAVAAIDQARDEIGSGIDLAFAAAADPLAALRLVVDGFAAELESSGFARGCPVTTVALETDSDTPRLGASCAKAYADWQSRICKHLLAAGISCERAPRLATFALSAIEGALILARAQRSRAPLDDAIAELAFLFERPVANAR
tara:strand:+ start:210485 stop:211108 length:624 start_codon:yes stop_codon:yes gene_type:complete